MKNKTYILAVALALHSLVAFADNETILVSDIDDTIKVSHVLDPDSTIANAINTKNAFLGMAELYNLLRADKKVDSFVYLSNAPKFLMYRFHNKFLKVNGFPEGSLLLNAHGIKPKNHKIDSLRKLITEKKPKHLLLIGDNGEKDIEIYAQISKEFPELKMTTFIHVVYSSIGFRKNHGKPLEINQQGFATSIDLAAELNKQALLTDGSYNELTKAIIPLALKEKTKEKRGLQMMFPAWLDCRDFGTFTLPVIAREYEDLITAFDKKINDRCDAEPFSN